MCVQCACNVNFPLTCDDGDRAARIIQEALGIERDDVANYVFPKTWPADREQRARIIGEWLQTEERFLAVRRGREIGKVSASSGFVRQLPPPPVASRDPDTLIRINGSPQCLE